MSNNYFIWSRSRDYIMRSCPKKYFFNYLVNDDTEIIKLKNLKSRFVIRSGIVRNTLFSMINDYLYGFDTAIEEYFDTALNEISEIIKSNNSLFEKFYNTLDKVDFNIFYLEIKNMLFNFYNSRIFEFIKQFHPKDIIIPATDESFDSFNFLDYKIAFKPDIIIKTKEKIIIINFNFNNDFENNIDTLETVAVLSALFYQSNYDTNMIISSIIYSLKENSQVEIPVDKNLFAKKIEELKNSITTMLFYNQKNDIEDFVKTQNLSNCAFCSYKIKCE